MSNGTGQHPNAPLTPEGRRRMVACVLDRCWSVAATAERFQVDAKTVRKWRDRFLAEGDAGLWDRSSRPRRSPNRTPEAQRRRVLQLRRKRRWGAAHIGFEVGLAASTVQAILNASGVGRLDQGDRATHTPKLPAQRYQRERPGELIHVDVKKLGGIPSGGGWRTRGRGYPGEGAKARMVGYRYLHSAIDDRTRIVYSEILDNEQASTAAGFWARAAAWYQSIGIPVERVITDNGPCYRSGLWHRACAATATTVNKTRPYRPQTNGKIERYHRILLEEWAYIRPWTSETQRARAYTGFVHFYNHHRSHGALGWATPTSILKDNLPAMHIEGSASGSGPARPDIESLSPPPRNGWADSHKPTPRVVSKTNSPDSAVSRFSSSTKPATSPSKAKPPTCSSNWYQPATNEPRSSSPPTNRSDVGAKSSETPSSPPP